MLSTWHSADRQWYRVAVEMQAQLFANSDGQSHTALALDLSWNGARLRASDLVLRPGDPIDLVLVSREGRDRRLARVVWVNQQTLEAGVEFLQPWRIKPPTLERPHQWAVAHAATAHE